MDAIILAGGKGTRMEEDVPKALVKVFGKAIIHHQIDNLLKYQVDRILEYQVGHLAKSNHIDKIVLALGHRSPEVIEYIRKHFPGKNIDFSIETEPLGTGGAVRQAMQKTSSKMVLVLNCDDITDIPVDKLSALTENTICVCHPRLGFGLVVEDGKGYARFIEKPLLPDWVSCGWYILERENLLKVLPEKGSIEYDVYPKIKIRLYKHEGFWRPLNSRKDLQEFEFLGELPEFLR